MIYRVILLSINLIIEFIFFSFTNLLAATADKSVSCIKFNSFSIILFILLY